MAGGFTEFVAELVAPLGGTSVRRMFSGHGVFRDGVMFAIVVDDVLYLRADEATRPRFEAEESRAFSYRNRGRAVLLPYWRVPDRLFDDPDEFLEWARASFGAAARARRVKTPARSAARGRRRPGSAPKRRGR